jgi:hypothetical protein
MKLVLIRGVEDSGTARRSEAALRAVREHVFDTERVQIQG